MTTPPRSAPRNGLPGDLNATNSADGINQLLGAPAIQQLGTGNPVVTPSAGSQGYFTHSTDSAGQLATTDFAQAFTMSGTTIGRVTVPIKAYGNGADLLLTLCADNAGVPNVGSPICQVKVPAAVITTLGAQYGMENSTGSLVSPILNTHFATNFSPIVNWISPAATLNGAPSYFAVATSGYYTILAGGRDQVGGAPVAAVFTVQYTGGGQVSAPLPQPALPQATQNGMLAATADTLVFSGGFTTGTVPVANVWSASWNPGTGAIGAWSAQTALPAAIQNGAGASYGEYVYVVGGQTGTTAATAVATVYMNTVSNSQLGNWVAMSPLPQAMTVPFVGVVGGWLIVAGGQNAAGTILSTCYYAAINPADGSLGPWQTGPSLAQAVCTLTPNWCTGVTASSLIVDSGYASGGSAGTYVQTLAANADGVAPQWNIQTSSATGVRASSAFPDADGGWYVMGFNVDNTAQQNFFQPVPLVSVPLYATGLSSGSTYWIVAQEVQSGSASDYLGIGMNFGAYSTDAKVSARHQNSWSTYFAGTSVPLTVYDATPSNLALHTVEDLVSGTQSAVYERWSTLLYNRFRLLTGVVDVTMRPNVALNSNPTFTTGVSPWTAVNGTITQSSAETHGGYPFSGLLTPTGGFPQAYAASELLPVRQTPYGDAQWVVATGWFYTPTTWANFSLSVSWFDSSETYISTSGEAQSLTGATWTSVTNYFQPPATAAYGQLVPTMSGTPAATNLLYMSDVPLTLTLETVPALASIAVLDYAAGPPNLTSVTQLN